MKQSRTLVIVELTWSWKIHSLAIHRIVSCELLDCWPQCLLAGFSWGGWSQHGGLIIPEQWYHRGREGGGGERLEYKWHMRGALWRWCLQADSMWEPKEERTRKTFWGVWHLQVSESRSATGLWKEEAVFRASFGDALQRGILWSCPAASVIWSSWEKLAVPSVVDALERWWRTERRSEVWKLTLAVLGAEQQSADI